MSDEEPAANESLQAHLRWLEGLADAPEQLLDLSDEDLISAGIGEELIRVSVGIEDVRDIIDDLGTALKISQR